MKGDTYVSLGRDNLFYSPSPLVRATLTLLSILRTLRVTATLLVFYTRHGERRLPS